MVDQVSYLELAYWQVALATLLILVNGGSLWRSSWTWEGGCWSPRSGRRSSCC